VNTWNKTLAAAALAVAAAVVGAPIGQAQASGSADVLAEHQAAHTPRIVDLRVGRHAHVDRVVVDIRGTVPGHTLRYVRHLYYDPSGNPVPLHGRRFLSLSLSPAATHTAAGTSVYTGPRLRQYNLPVLRGVALTGDFEGVVSFGISLRRHVAFHVFVLHAPNRIVVDLHH
jgi:hypothetical protein